MAEGDGAKTEATETARYSREAAVEGARALTGESPHVVAGALAGETAQTFSETKLKKLVSDFTKRPEAGAEGAE